MAVSEGNRLAGATSPYLLQHATNPVDWFEWGDEAFARARELDRPVLLSVGYAACHWCHVMAHESFEDPATAALMNANFVSIKVDREERPDVDAIYMDAVQAMTGQGGWPMTVFLTPDGEPFYAGTYFPPEPRHGMPAFSQVLSAVSETWRGRRADVLQQGGRVAEALRRSQAAPASGDAFTPEVLDAAARGLAGAFDHRWGGFGGAPKFPQPMTLEFLLRMHLHGTPGALDMVTRTLDRMADGGIQDQIGGGFHRYSVDGRWHVPHFEKMLYDNALLARLYLHGWLLTGIDRYRATVVDILDYLLRAMRHPDGGFFSSQDADSEGVEGRFYVWSWHDLVAAGGEPVARWFGALPEGNWEAEGANVLWTPRPLGAVAAESGDMEPAVLAARIEEARGELFEAREHRVRPGVDDKVLAAWNGLAVSAFAEAGWVLGEDRYVRAAEAAAGFVLTEMRDASGAGLSRSWRAGRVSGPGFLEDHAMVAAGCLDLYRATFDPRWFVEARRLADLIVERFTDDAGGGLFQTAAGAERLIARPKELFDNAVPAGNSVAAEVFVRLALLTGEAAYERAAASALSAVRGLADRAPSALGHALGAADLLLAGGPEIAIVGPDGPERRALVDEVRRRFLPNAVLAAADPEDDPAVGAVALLADRSTVGGHPAAYVCRKFVCSLPVTGPGDLAAVFDQA
jgi:uncharacterized protein YyaL (SSP411 family)